MVGLLVVGARRLQHLRYLANDPLFARFCGLARIPSDRTVVNWLKQFTQCSLRALTRINSELLYEQIEQLKLRRLTIDLDGTVIRTGDKVAWAMRGFNPHHPKDPSYYPLLAHLAQTGQILRLKNRPGNVHDSKGAERFVRELIGEIRTRLGCALTGIPDGRGLFPAKSAQAAQPPGFFTRSKYPCVGGPGCCPVVALMQAVAFADDEVQTAMRTRLTGESGEIGEIEGPESLVNAVKAARAANNGAISVADGRIAADVARRYALSL